ncbi:MAG: HAMP domain-containing sensor histidine kinase [Xanthomonadales bacterium]|nr:HAMP domain-containing sensor histidine kinase [Xanthomonadales bacterium]
MRGKTGSVRGNLVRVFALQAMAISVAVILGVFAAAKVVENVLVNEALEGEAAHFWALYEQNPQVARPNTRNLLAYLRHPEHGDEIPDWLADVAPGFRRVDSGLSHPLVHVSDRGAARLYLVFDEIQVSRLAMYFGVAPLSIVLLLVYTVTFIGYRLTRRAVSPLVQLAGKFEAVDARASDLAAIDLDVDAPVDSEVQVLAAALQDFVIRIGEFVQRERNFTRNASHELRTPLAVMRANVDALKRRAGDEEQLAQPIARLERTVRDMEKLLETLLILAREDESSLPREGIIVNDLVTERIDQVTRALNKESVSVSVDAQCLLQVQAPPRVLGIIVDNILRNAIQHTPSGVVKVHVLPGEIRIEDSGPGMDDTLLRHVFEPFHRGDDREGGFGLGLAIVKRLCERFGWSVTIDSEPSRGTTVTLLLPGSVVVGQRE